MTVLSKLWAADTFVNVSELARRRADADRNVAAILDAAATVLGQDPRASMSAVAEAAGLTRQTVYAHFASRDALRSALIDRATGEVLGAIEAANLDRLPAAEALFTLVGISWRAFADNPVLLTIPTADADRERERHQPVIEHLERIARRGRRTGEFDRAVPTSWIVAATMALGHAAGEQVRAGQLSAGRAEAMLRRSLSRLLLPGSEH